MNLETLVMPGSQFTWEADKVYDALLYLAREGRANPLEVRFVGNFIPPQLSWWKRLFESPIDHHYVSGVIKLPSPQDLPLCYEELLARIKEKEPQFGDCHKLTLTSKDNGLSVNLYTSVLGTNGENTLALRSLQGEPPGTNNKGVDIYLRSTTEFIGLYSRASMGTLKLD